MSRKNIKQRKETEEKARLRQRLTDLAIGAYGGYEMPDFCGDTFISMASDLGLDAFGRWIGAIRNTFLDGDKTDHRISDTNLENFDSLHSATEWLWEQGVRPEGKRRAS